MEGLENEILAKLIQSVVIVAVALGLFLGLKGRILVFARWANLPRLALTPVRVMLRYSILIIAAILLLGRWGFETTALISVIGGVLGLVAIGFVAVWSVLSNFLCTFVLIVFKPFSVGDEIELPAAGVRGRVVDLSVVFTTLEISPGETAMIPNNTFFQSIFKRRAGAVTVQLADQLRQPSVSPSPAAQAG